MKILITFVVIAVALISAAIIAKLVDKFYEKRIVTDDASDISDNTRDLIRTRLAVIQFRKKELNKSKRPNIRSIFRRWSEKVRNRTKMRDGALQSKRPAGDPKAVVNEEHVIEEIEAGTTLRSPRSPIFSGGSSPVFSRKLSKDMADGRKPTKLQTVTPTEVNSVVAKGRPVSSKPHILSSSPVNIKILSTEQKQTIGVDQSNDKNDKSQPLDINKPPIPSSSPDNTKMLPTEQKQTINVAKKQTINVAQDDKSQPPDISL